MMFDKDGRPYVKSPLMAQYFAGHMQTHYKRIAMSWVAIGGAVLLIGGASLKGCDTSASSPSVGGGEVNGQIWDFLYSIPIVKGIEESVFGPNPATRHQPTVYHSEGDPAYQHFPTTTVAGHVGESGGESAPPQSGDSDWYTCTPGTKWCDS